MGLRKSPELTRAFIAANRRNARKSTGPKTARGKARTSLNALKGGQYARNLLLRMRAAGIREVAELFGDRQQMLRLFEGKDAPILADRMANTRALAIWRAGKVRRKRPPFHPMIELSSEQIERIERFLASYPPQESKTSS